MTFIEETLRVVLYAFIVTALPILLKKVSGYVDLKQNEITSNIDNAIVKDRLNNAIDLVQAIVLEVAQTYVDPLKESNSFTNEAAVEAKAMALDKAKLLLSIEGLSFLEGLYGDANVWLGTQIEAYVKSLKI